MNVVIVLTHQFRHFFWLDSAANNVTFSSGFSVVNGLGDFFLPPIL